MPFLSEAMVVAFAVRYTSHPLPMISFMISTQSPCSLVSPSSVVVPNQAKLSHAALEVQKQLAEQQRGEALLMVSELEAQLADIGAEIATHMQVGKSYTHKLGGTWLSTSVCEALAACASVLSTSALSLLLCSQLSQCASRPCSIRQHR